MPIIIRKGIKQGNNYDNKKFCLKMGKICGIIQFVLAEISQDAGKPNYMETYRSGHNEPHSKCGCPQGHVGSNPTVSANEKPVTMRCCWLFHLIIKCQIANSYPAYLHLIPCLNLPF